MTKLAQYREFLRAKAVVTPDRGFVVTAAEVNPMLKPHQIVLVIWACLGGCRAIFAKFGLGKTFIQLETVRITLAKAMQQKDVEQNVSRGTGDTVGRALITCPLGVRGEFIKQRRWMVWKGLAA
jgi:hypothetical protein